jgi:hypothetical protein
MKRVGTVKASVWIELRIWTSLARDMRPVTFASSRMYPPAERVNSGLVNGVRSYDLYLCVRRQLLIE